MFGRRQTKFRRPLNAIKLPTSKYDPPFNVPSAGSSVKTLIHQVSTSTSLNNQQTINLSQFPINNFHLQT
ncbi:MAG: hypothetical protein ACTS7I_02165 [Candidatus Hodgkinia cicadicola]